MVGGESINRRVEQIDLIICRAEAKGIVSGFVPLVQKVVIPLLEEQCLSMTPPEADWKALYATYRQKNHSIFPILDLKRFEALEPAQPASILLRQGICPVSSMTWVRRIIYVY